MANDKTDVIDGGVRKEQIMPMALNNITGSALEARKKPPTALLQQSGLPFSAMLDVPMELVFEVGRTDITIKQLMELNKGSFIELRQVSVDTIEVRINDRLYAFGETIALQQRYGVRFGEVEVRAGVDDVEDDKPAAKNNG